MSMQHLSEPIPSLSTDRFSLNCNNTLSSSAPPAYSTYSPFSSIDETLSDTFTASVSFKSKRKSDLNRYSSQKQQQQQQQQCSSYATAASSLQQYTSTHEKEQNSQFSTFRLSTVTTDSQNTPIASSSPMTGLANPITAASANPTTAAPLHTTTPSVTSNTSASSCIPIKNDNSTSLKSTKEKTLAKTKSAKDRVAEREQRRHSSEDGLTSCLRTPSSSLPTSIDNNSSSNSSVSYAIPTKCQMVFYMRDEVPRPREEDKTGLSEKRCYQYRPQLQPRVRFHSSNRQLQMGDEGSMLSPPTSHTPMKKPNSSGKSVSFKEPEPWRDVTPVPPSSSIQAEKQENNQQPKHQVRMLFTRLDIPTIKITEPEENHESLASSSQSIRRPTSEPILCSGSTMLSSLSSTHRHTQGHSPSRGKSSTPPPRLSASNDQSFSVTASRHRRNMSMPSQSSIVASSPPSVIPKKAQTCSSNGMFDEPKIKSGNRLLRLWKSATHKYSNHHAGAHGVGLRKGSDLEPLVSLARD